MLFGALAGAGALPFAREAFEATIRAGGVGVEPSLRAFAAGLRRARRRCGIGPTHRAPPKPAAAEALPQLAPIGDAGFDALVARCAHEVSRCRCTAWSRAGLRQVVDFQDVAYGREYLDRVAGFLRLERGGDPA